MVPGALAVLIGLIVVIVLRRRLGVAAWWATTGLAVLAIVLWGRLGPATRFAVAAFALLLVYHVGWILWEQVYSVALYSPEPLFADNYEQRMRLALDVTAWVHWGFAAVSVITVVVLLAAVFAGRHPVEKSSGGGTDRREG